VVGVPTGAFRDTLEKVRPDLAPWMPVVSLSKGLERGTHLRMTEVIKEVLPGRPAAALTGPNLAREIMAGQAAASVIATEDLTVAAALQREVARGMFRVYTHHDVIGCEVGGALKNVIAIATGMAQGLGVGDNTRAGVMSRGLAELTTLAVAMGGEATTLAGLAGMGDLVATCMSPQSRNRHVGEQLGLGRTLEEILGEMRMVAEGVKTSATVVELADQYGLDLPIARTINDVVTGKIRAADAYRGLIRAVPAGHESQPG
jgi:glycerol-3-phosphate dehydrogenase (NAD(P)+)